MNTAAKIEEDEGGENTSEKKPRFTREQVQTPEGNSSLGLVGAEREHIDQCL